MAAAEMPVGRYLSAAVSISPHAGGQTRALLLRNRLFRERAGVRPTLLSFGAYRDLDEQRHLLRERRLLLPDTPLLNIHEHYRDRSRLAQRRDAGQDERRLADLGRFRIDEQLRPTGEPWRVVYRDPRARNRRVYDYLRSDGTPYLRIPTFGYGRRRSWPRSILVVDKDGTVAREHGSLGEWYRQWVRELTDDGERTFLFMDSRALVPHLAALRLPHVHLVYLMHNMHLQGAKRWDSPMSEEYRRVLGNIDALDAMVTLTDRQRADIGQRRGLTTNMFVVPNPVDVPAAPDPPPARDPRRVMTLARLTKQKRLHHAVRVMEKVVEQVPDARLDVYGDGVDRAALEAEIAAHDLADRVLLHGYDPTAQRELWSASVFLLTSSFEGYPLATLESMSHGCPVVSYDIKYGPREQVGDGVDGFLVPSGDVPAAADRVVRLLTSPELVRELGVAARRKAEHHGYERFLADWRQVLETVLEQRGLRTRLGRVDLRVDALGAGGRVPLAGTMRRLVRGAARRWRPHARVLTERTDRPWRLVGDLRVRDADPVVALDSAVVTLAAVDRGTGEVRELPLQVQRRDFGFRVTADLDPADLFPVGDDAVRLRLRLVCRNTCRNATAGVIERAGRGRLRVRPAGTTARQPPAG